jgi:hypothetical protein
MAPPNGPPPIFPHGVPFSEVMATTRSAFRKDFCSETVELAKHSFDKFRKDDGQWSTVYESAVSRHAKCFGHV